MKTLTRLIQFLTGALFLFSGFVKAVDPLGTAYKMHDYFAAFAQDFPAFSWLWTFMTATLNFWALFMLVLELMLGLALITGWRPKLTLWLTLLLMFFFTFLTGYTYLSGYTVEHWYNPASWVFHEKDMKVTDCGCFGDFMKLKPYTSFYKDVVIDFIVLFLLSQAGRMYSLLKGRTGAVVMTAGTVAAMLLCFSNYLWGLPVIDFRPYAVGKNIREGMTLPPDAVKDSVQMVFIYEKDGKQMELDLEQIKTIDSTYHFVDRLDKVIREGDHPAIHDFSITADDGTDLTDDVLNQDRVFLLVSWEINQAETKVQPALNAFAQQAQKDGIEFIGLAGSTPGDVERFRHENNSAFTWYFCDATALKTMIRSNPGLVLLKKGTVAAKWHWRHIPAYDAVRKQLLQ